MKTKGIVVNDVSFSYERSSPELQNITTKIPPETFCGITGVNGSGKSTFAYLLNGLIPHQVDGTFSGDVSINGVNTREKSVSYFAHRVGFVFQNPDFMIFNLTIREEVAFGVKNLGLNNVDHRVAQALQTVGLSGFEDRDPHTLSLGQKQKLCLAIAIAMDTEYIVLDEPTAMLDYASSLHLYKLLSSLHQKGKTIIVIEHDTDFLLTYAQHVLVFDKGSLILQDRAQVIFNQQATLQKLGIKVPHIVPHE